MNTENEIYQKLKEFILKVSRRKTIGDDDDIFEEESSIHYLQCSLLFSLKNNSTYI